jgi:hypothetical protein
MVTQTTVKRTPIRTQLDILMGSSAYSSTLGMSVQVLSEYACLVLVETTLWHK